MTVYAGCRTFTNIISQTRNAVNEEKADFDSGFCRHRAKAAFMVPSHSKPGARNGTGLTIQNRAAELIRALFVHKRFQLVHFLRKQLQG